jgi:prepilin-type N-terminal cleavage/methylation domain-containing protein
MTQVGGPGGQRGGGAGRRGQSGMTLVELMIAMAILGIVIAAAFNVAFTMMSSYRDHRRSVAVERAARGAMAVLTSAVRNASPGLADADIMDLVGCTQLKGVDVVNSSTGPDVLRVVHARGGVITSLRQDFGQDDSSIVVLDGSGFSAGDQVVVTDFDKAVVMEIDSLVDGGAEWTLNLVRPPSDCGAFVGTFNFEVLATVLRAQVAEFSISETPVPVLMMDRDGPGTTHQPEPVAEGIEDLQIAIGVDQNPIDGQIGPDVALAPNDDEWIYNFPGDSPPTADITAAPYRALRITVTARSVEETSTVPISRRPPAEDRDGAEEADPFRRRSLSTTVEIRNLRGSPQ